MQDGGRLPLLVEDPEGYRNLCRLLTRIKMRASKGEGAAGWDDLEEHVGGLVCLTGGPQGPVAHRLERDGHEILYRPMGNQEGERFESAGRDLLGHPATVLGLGDVLVPEHRLRIATGSTSDCTHPRKLVSPGGLNRSPKVRRR